MLGDCISKLILEPTNRRILFHAWNPAQLDAMALPPCHLLYQFLPNIAKGELSLSMTQRSADFFLGVPFNIASAALLLHVVARMTGFKPKYVNLTFNDAHIYVNHLDQVKEQLSREARPLPELAIKNWTYQDPEGMLSLQHIRTFFRCTDTGQATKEEILGGMVAKAIAHLGELNPDWFTLEGYDPHPALTAPMAV
jgi:thymidylate synthase